MRRPEPLDDCSFGGLVCLSHKIDAALDLELRVLLGRDGRGNDPDVQVQW